MDTDTIKVLNFTATETISSFEFNELVGQTVFGAFKDGVQYVVITTGEPDGKQVLFDTMGGGLIWGIPFEVGEVMTILYF
jgi:hypothetical protein